MPLDCVPGREPASHGDDTRPLVAAPKPEQSTDQSAALLGAALLYSLVTIGVFFGAFPLFPLGPLSLLIPLFLVVFPLIALMTMVILRVGQIRFHWLAMVGFTIIILGTSWLQLLITSTFMD